jgi:predicted adenylyl cyclase CyaB
MIGRNVEIKARVDDPEALRARVESIAEGEPEELRQEDIFFHCTKGRLKLRVSSGREGELIYYQRSDSDRAQLSEYVKASSEDPEALRDALERSLGVRGVIRKTRLVYLAGQTRIHLDRVEDLGDFVELEVVLSSTDSVAEGQRVAEHLQKVLGIADENLIDRAYIDLTKPDDDVTGSQAVLRTSA